MKFHITPVAVLVCALAGLAFSINTPSVEDCYDAKLVRSWVELDPLVLQGDTFLEKGIYRSGDRIALGVVHAFTQKELVDPARINRILSITRLSFSQPKYITRSEDKDPAVTRLLLSFLRHQCEDKELIQKIVDTEMYVSAQVRVVQ